MDFNRWAKEYVNNYNDTISYQNNNGEMIKETSPVFENISKSLQKRRYLKREEFINICKWKTPRPKKHYQENNKKKIEKITKKVFSEHPDTKSQMTELIKLKGVSAPVASALLTVIYPKIYCIVDFRVWNSLLWMEDQKSLFKNYSSFSDFINNFRSYGNVTSYIFYMERIKKLAEKHSMIPREIEMALWQYDKCRGKLI
jgi:hypothetical protein